jgi:hypothetical protein
MGAAGAFFGDSIAYILDKRCHHGVTRMLGRKDGNGDEKIPKAVP